MYDYESKRWHCTQYLINSNYQLTEMYVTGSMWTILFQLKVKFIENTYTKQIKTKENWLTSLSLGNTS